MANQEPGVEWETLMRLVGMLGGFQISQALHAAAKLRIFDQLAEGAKTSEEIAEATGAHEPSLRRLLRALTTIEILREDDAGRFTATPLGDMLRSDHPVGIHPWAVMYGEPFFWQPWSDLYETVRTGAPAFDRRFGQPFFDYLSEHPHESALFDAFLTGRTTRERALILDAYDFSGFETIVDVGGGQGALLRGILERYPDARGILCDLPSVLEGATEITESPVAGRCELVAVDMFESVPAGGDAYMFKLILHDWSDAEARRILQNCREAIREDGKVLVIESLLEPPNRPDPAKWVDLTMLLLLSGRERTEDEFRELFASAGFTLTDVIPAGGMRILEGVAA